MTYRPMNGGALLPIARLGRLGRLGWFVEGATSRGHTWTMGPMGGAMLLDEQQHIAKVCADALRRNPFGGGRDDGDARERA